MMGNICYLLLFGQREQLVNWCTIFAWLAFLGEEGWASGRSIEIALPCSSFQGFALSINRLWGLTAWVGIDVCNNSTLVHLLHSKGRSTIPMENVLKQWEVLRHRLWSWTAVVYSLQPEEYLQNLDRYELWPIFDWNPRQKMDLWGLNVDYTNSFVCCTSFVHIGECPPGTTWNGKFGWFLEQVTKIFVIFGQDISKGIPPCSYLRGKHRILM